MCDVSFMQDVLKDKLQTNRLRQYVRHHAVMLRTHMYHTCMHSVTHICVHICCAPVWR